MNDETTHDPPPSVASPQRKLSLRQKEAIVRRSQRRKLTDQGDALVEIRDQLETFGATLTPAWPDLGDAYLKHLLGELTVDVATALQSMDAVLYRMRQLRDKGLL